ncbi:hypothetical protein C3731_05340 [Brucella oryzae]|uniref:Uncharacterized protein n=1 Tax=Brucella oryzae TaxID=335286 RepID=A0A2S7J321_9HYPH|nr:hypothetical protein C3731_05340 [Brucella oryzae]
MTGARRDVLLWDMNNGFPAGSSVVANFKPPEGQGLQLMIEHPLDMLELVHRVNIKFFTCKNYND